MYAALAAVPVRTFPVQPGLDASWAFALHYFQANGLVHGRDVACTYGPLAWLAIPMPVAGHLGYGVAFQIAFWAALAALLLRAALAPETRVINLALFALCTSLAMPALPVFSYAGFDLFLGFLCLVLLGAAAHSPRGWMYFAAACALACVMCFIKFSGGILGMSAVAGFAAAEFVSGRRRAALMAAGLPVLFAAAWLLYDASFSSLARYVRSGLELSSGYSAAMSLSLGGREWVAGALLVAGTALLAGVLAWRRDPLFPLAAAAAGPMFLTFKQSFVREAGHMGIIFTFAPLVWAALLLHARWQGQAWRYWAPVLAAGVVLWYPHAPVTQLPLLAGAARAGARGLAPAAPPGDQAVADRLPAGLLARIGAQSVAIFPWEASYAAVNPIRYRPFPVFQTYQAYTAYLDAWNAEFLEDAARAPAFLLFDWDAIDGRHPLLDAPALTVSILRHYDLDSVHGPHLLLRRRSAARFGAPRLLATLELRGREPLALPESAQPRLARITLDLSAAGAARNLLFRLPETVLVAELDGGRFLAHRVPPGVLRNDVPLDYTALDAASLKEWFGGAPLPRIRTLALGGEGLDAFRGTARVEIFELPGFNAPAAPPPNFPGKLLGELDSFRIEAVNGVGMDAVEREEPVHAGRANYLLITGWAVDSFRGTAAGGVAAMLGDRAYPVVYGLPRADIASLYGNSGYVNCGFEWRVPLWVAAKNPELRLRIAARDGSGYYRTPRGVRLPTR